MARAVRRRPFFEGKDRARTEESGRDFLEGRTRGRGTTACAEGKARGRMETLGRDPFIEVRARAKARTEALGRGPFFEGRTKSSGEARRTTAFIEGRTRPRARTEDAGRNPLFEGRAKDQGMTPEGTRTRAMASRAFTHGASLAPAPPARGRSDAEGGPGMARMKAYAPVLVRRPWSFPRRGPVLILPALPLGRAGRERPFIEVKAEGRPVRAGQ
jgi:hypothetical protein